MMDLHDLNALKSSNPDLNENRYPNPNSVHPDTFNSIQPPQLPLRENQIIDRRSSSYGNFSQPSYGTSPLYNSFSVPNTSGYYNGYSGSTYHPYNSSLMNSSGAYGIGNNSNSFLRAAEENSRSAFQSIESVVSALTAVSAMFESTYFAVYNSFRAVVGVADQFYRLKTHLTNILSAFAAVRFIKYFFRKLLRLIRLGKSNCDLENADKEWSIAGKYNDAEKLVMETRKGTNWPLIMFFGVVFGGPWLIWRILSSIEANNKDDSLWMTGKIDHFIAVSEYDFDSVNVDELSFRRGQRIIIAPKEYQPKIRGWLLGSIDGQTQGIMPANYLKIMGKKQGESCIKIGKGHPVPATCPNIPLTEPVKSTDKLEAIFEEKTF